jgi:hypothetical protein
MAFSYWGMLMICQCCCHWPWAVDEVEQVGAIMVCLCYDTAGAGFCGRATVPQK